MADRLGVSPAVVSEAELVRMIRWPSSLDDLRLTWSLEPPGNGPAIFDVDRALNDLEVRMAIRRLGERDRQITRHATVIGQVVDEPLGRVVGRTSFGGHRMIDFLAGDPLPRIC